jgi:multimeric flavodoxin WrbA
MEQAGIVAILGSPRAGGNTDALADAMLSGAREAGASTERFALRDMTIRPCTGCDGCWKQGRPCRFQDDGSLLYDAMAGAKVFLFVTPVYWYGPTAIMKAFIDRLVVFNRPEGRPLVDGKRAVLIAAWEEAGMAAAAPMVQSFEMSFGYLGLRFDDRLLVDGVGPKGAIAGKPEALDRARTMGRALA